MEDLRILASLVVTYAGMLASTAMPLGPYSAASDTDRWSTYALVAPYTARRGMGTPWPEILPMLTTQPLLRSTMAGRHAYVIAFTETMLRATRLSISSGVSSRKYLGWS